MKVFFFPILFLVLTTPTSAQITQSNETASMPNEPQNAEMLRIYEQDQRDREDRNSPIDWNVVVQADSSRRARTRYLLDHGQLKAVKDFERAAMIFQHGNNADDYLLAHCLAMIAASQGDTDARWLSAASLDRYLWAIGKDQIFGTQFQTNASDKMTQAPYRNDLLSDRLRQNMTVVPISEQVRLLEKLISVSKK